MFANQLRMFPVLRGNEAIVGHAHRFLYNYDPGAKKSEKN